MTRRTFRLLSLFFGTFALLLITGTAVFGAGRAQVDVPSEPPLDQAALESFWHSMYPDSMGIANASNVYTYELLAKAQPDECFNGIGIPMTVTDIVPDCVNGVPKVNQAYVWGMTDYQETIWFGTAPNVHCLVIGGYLGMTAPTETDSYVCEFGESRYSPPLPDIIGDWRPPRLYIYDNETEGLSDISPNGQNGKPFDPRFAQNTLGIRSATTFGDYVFFAGPAFTPTTSINVFLFNAATQTYVGGALIPGYGNVRKWIEVDGVLYVAVGKAAGSGGAVLRYTGNPASGNPLELIAFEEVGLLDEDAAEIALHEGRLFVNTWPNCPCSVAGLWMSPVIPDGGLTTADAGNWEKVFSYDEYEPDPVVASTYGGGALFSYQGELYWGTMHVPGTATAAHFGYYGPDYALDGGPGEEDYLLAVLGSLRSVSIFRGSDFGTPDEEIEVLYGMPELPAFDPDTMSWIISPTLLGPPLYGMSGFGNMFNNYTWAMAEYDDQLFVGTMDWSYLLIDVINSLLGTIELPTELPFEFDLSLPTTFAGADLYRFYSNDEPAVTENLSGMGNYGSYGIRNLTGRDDGLYLGMANPMNLMTDLEDDKPEGGWELLRLTRHLMPLTVTKDGNGGGVVVSDPVGVDCGETCEVGFDIGSTVILSATPDADSTFVGWSGACIGTAGCEVTMSEGRQVTATFAKIQYPLTVNVVGGGSGNVVSDPSGVSCSLPSCTTSFEISTTVSLSALGFSGSSFEGWSGDCSGAGLCAVMLDGPKVITATFVQNPQQAILDVTGSFQVGSPLTLTATLNMNSLDSCTWDFGDGATESCVADVVVAGVDSGVDAVHDITLQTTHVYTQAGVYVAMVTATNEAGTVVAAQEITIQVPTAENPDNQPTFEGTLFFPFLNR